jgi:2-C-methyl-D-erythritol 4-phosphate cytidylyltransferase
VKAAAIVVAAGASTRMGADKLWADLGGEPVLGRTLRAITAVRSIDLVVVVTRPDCLARVEGLAGRLSTPTTTCVGGARRQDSVRAGLELVDPTACDVVAVHDGARPLVEPALFDEGVRLARDKGAAVAALPCTDTIKRAGADRRVLETPPRAELWAVQTPQCFRIELLRRAHASVTADQTDDAALVEALGEPVWLYPGSRRNIKVTTPEDLVVARALVDG